MIHCLFLNILFLPLQAAYMHEVYEDSHGQDPFTGLLGLALLFGAVYLYDKYKTSQKEAKERRKQMQSEMESASLYTEKMVKSGTLNFRFQNRESWQKGYSEARYDSMHNKYKPLSDKTIEELTQEYTRIGNLGYISAANKILEEIGYKQYFEKK